MNYTDGVPSGGFIELGSSRLSDESERLDHHPQQPRKILAAIRKMPGVQEHKRITSGGRGVTGEKG